MPVALHTSEQLFEIRFTPNARILDRRGSWAEEFARQLELKRWEISENRVDVFSDDRNEHAFVSFRNAGYISLDAAAPQKHREQAQRFATLLCSMEGFASPLRVDRIGVRGKYCVAFNGPFDDLFQRVLARYIAPNARLLETLGKDVKLKDIGAPLNFLDATGHFNTNCGPMAREQMRGFFTHREADTLPDVGLYIDIDYWEKTEGLRTAKEIAQTIHSFSQAAGNRLQQVSSVVLEGE